VKEYPGTGTSSCGPPEHPLRMADGIIWRLWLLARPDCMWMEWRDCRASGPGHRALARLDQLGHRREAAAPMLSRSLVDEVSLWDRELSQGEIQGVMATPDGPPTASWPGGGSRRQWIHHGDSTAMDMMVL